MLKQSGAVHFQKLLPGQEALGKVDGLALVAGEVLADGFAVVEITDIFGDDEPVVLIEGDEVPVEGGVLGFGEAESVGGVKAFQDRSKVVRGHFRLSVDWMTVEFFLRTWIGCFCSFFF